MTRPRLGRAAMRRLAEQRLAQDAERQMSMIERDLAAIERLTRSALMATIAYSKGKMSRVRYEAIFGRLNRELDAMDEVREASTDPVYDPPAMKS